MAEPMRPESQEKAPDPSTSYERSHPGRESGEGKLDADTDQATPKDESDRSVKGVPNAHDGSRQLNAHDVIDQRD